MELSKEGMTSMLNKITYSLTFAILYLVSLIPLRLLYLVSDFVCLFVRRYYRRNIVREQLCESFPDKDTAELRAIERAFYRHFCDLFVEIVKQFSMSKKEMMKRMQFCGHEEMMGNCDAKNPLMLVMLGHQANWEWVASLQYWLPAVHCTQVYHPLYNKVFDRIFINVREQYGGETIAMKQAVRRLLQLHHEGRITVCGMISDQQPKWDAIHHFSRFLNHDSAVFVGTEQIAKKLGTKVYYASITQVRRGYYQCRFIPLCDSSKEIEDYGITDKYMQMLEADIRENPAMWLWTHKRWSRTKEERERRNQQ